MEDRKKMRVAVVGCGAISDIYLTNMMEQFSQLEVVGCCASHPEHAQAKAEKYGIRAMTYEEMLADASIELIVNLTPAPAHYELIRRALEAGKHVYTEKTMTVEPEEAAKLIQLAKEKHLLLGSAPETFLGASFQTARKALDEGKIGEVTSFLIQANRDLNVLASYFTFLRMPGGGICYDYGVYYLTVLVSLLGGVKRVCGIVQNPYPVRTSRNQASEEFGKDYSYPNESQVSAVLQMESGVAGSFGLNGDSVLADQAVFRIYGTKGILELPDPNQFGGCVRLIPNSQDYAHPDPVQELKDGFPYSENSRGIGVAEMADAVREGRTSRVDAEMAYHVLDVISQMMKSSESGKMEEVTSCCKRPETFFH